MTSSHTTADQLLPADGDRGGRVFRVGPDRQEEAISRLVAPADSPEDFAQARRFMGYARTNAVRLDLLWAQQDAYGRIAASVLAVPSPGRTAMIFASHAASETEAIRIGGLIDHVCRELAGLQIDLAQALLDPLELLERRSFEAADFWHLAKLSYLERAIPRPGSTPPPLWPPGVSVQPYDESQRDHVLTALEASYENTLDCPALCGLRETRDVLEGHRATGQFEADLWTVLRIGEEIGGVLLLNPCPGSHTIELVYLGLAALARGRGLGTQLLRHGLALIAGRRERLLTLAVDERNAPALSLYKHHGFRRVLRRDALIRSLREHSRAEQ
jgi:ribosomal protein S18 acetylase RimI-like enzyme